MVSSVTRQVPGISIIIRTKNEERFIAQTLSAIFVQKIDLPFEVIVIDSGSTDRTLDIVQRFKTRLCMIDPGQFTYGRALNYAAGLAEGAYLINLSAHCIPVDDKWMVSLVAPLRSKSHVAATYGKQVPIKGLNPFEERTVTAAFSPDPNGKVRPPFSNSNGAVRTNIWRTYPFDEKATFAEDFIWSRVLPAEYQIEYVVDAAVYHTHPMEFKYWAKRSYQNGILVQYLAHVYGLRYPWASEEDAVNPVSWKKMLRMVRSSAAEWSGTTKFLLVNRYFNFVPLLPIYVLLERYYYQKGLAEGRRLYASDSRKA